MNTSKPTAVILAVLLAVSLAAPVALASTTAAQDEQEPTCSTEVAHDAFLDDDAVIEEFNETGSAADIQRNTRITIEETSSFYRVKGENPNSYCVHATDSVSSEILPPTTLGTVSSNNDNTEAKWEDVLDFDRQEAHTEITFVMPPNSTVLFAPSKPTVLIPAWRDSQKHEAQGIIGSIKEKFSDDKPLEKRTYTFSSNGSPSVTIPLTNDEDEEQRIDDWRAVYRTSPDEPWAPVDQESDEPVFYQKVEDGEKIRFYFNNEDAEVEFRANPTFKDSAVWEVRSFKRSVHDLGSIWPFAIIPANGGVVW